MKIGSALLVLEGKSRIVDQDKEPELAIQVSKLMSTKYDWDGGLIVELIQG